jgi:hypothetical protein
MGIEGVSDYRSRALSGLASGLCGAGIMGGAFYLRSAHDLLPSSGTTHQILLIRAEALIRSVPTALGTSNQ